MAKNIDNLIMMGFTGKLGGYILQRNGVIRRSPDFSNRILSPLQQEHLDRVSQARAYARRVKDDPLHIARYTSRLGYWRKKLGNNTFGVYQLAVKDWFDRPVIREVMLLRGGLEGEIRLEVFTLKAFGLLRADAILSGPDGEKQVSVDLSDAGHHPHFGIVFSEITSDAINHSLLLRITDFPGNTAEVFFTTLLTIKAI